MSFVMRVLFIAHALPVPELIRPAIFEALHMPAFWAISWNRQLHPLVKGKFINNDSVIFLAFKANKDFFTRIKILRQIFYRIRKIFPINSFFIISSSRCFFPFEAFLQSFFFGKRKLLEGRSFIVAKRAHIGWQKISPIS